jgi:hypothetical protein
MDSTVLDVFAMDPITLQWVRAELTVAMDWYTRCITGLRLTPASPKSVDATAEDPNVEFNLDTEHLDPYDSAGPLRSRRACRDQESPAAASRTNRQIDLRTETPPRADRLAPNTAMRGAHPRPA